MTPDERLRAFGERVARVMGLAPAGVETRAFCLRVPPHARTRWTVRVWHGQRDGDTFVVRKGFCATGGGDTEEAAVDAAIAALSARLAASAREQADAARVAAEAAEWWERVAQEVTR